MRERSELILKIVCGALAGLLLFQFARLVIHSNPLRSVRIPDLPSLPASLEAQTAAKGTNVAAGQAMGTNATNSVASQKPGEKGTNVAVGQATGTNATNSVPSQKPGEKGTNSTHAQTASAGQVSNTNTTNSVTSQKPGEKETNSTTAQASAKPETNSPANPPGPLETNSAPSQASQKAATNSLASDKTPTNAAPALASQKNDTNPVPARTAGKPGAPPSMSQSGMTKMPELPPLIQARIDKIVQSEILAPFMRPMPMALLGIAGQDAFLRAPSGQSGIVKVGDELGGIKLLQIGINRVLVEQSGEKKELTMFSGLGSESLLPKPKPATNETNLKPK